jgi:hypothetical protein
MDLQVRSRANNFQGDRTNGGFEDGFGIRDNCRNVIERKRLVGNDVHHDDAHTLIVEICCDKDIVLGCSCSRDASCVSKKVHSQSRKKSKYTKNKQKEKKRDTLGICCNLHFQQNFQC